MSKETECCWLSRMGQNIDQKIILETYKVYRDEKNLRYQMMMNETKFYITITSALLSMIAAGITFLGRTNYHNVTIVVCIGFVLFFILPPLTAYLSYVGIIHLKGSYIVYLEHISVIIKLEHILGIDLKVSTKCLGDSGLISEQSLLFKEDKYLIPDRWMDRRLRLHKTEDFINEVISAPQSYFKNMRNVYILYIVISLLIFSTGIFLCWITMPQKVILC